MRYRQAAWSSPKTKIPTLDRRIHWVGFGFFLGGLTLIARLFQLQVLEYGTYKVLAWDQHEVQSSLVPKRGTIYLRDRWDGTLYPIATDRDVWQVYASPKDIKDATGTATQLADILGLPQADLAQKLSGATSFYMVLAKDIPFEKIDQIDGAGLVGIGTAKAPARFYPEQGIGGQFLGFVKSDDQNHRSGTYGVEGYDDATLAGSYGSLVTEKDAAGRPLTIGTMQTTEKRDGSDLVLTIDRAIQYEACQKIQEAVQHFEAQGGSLIVMDPNSGAILAMCSTPDYDPASYGKIGDVGVLNNPATFENFEPGSVFKPVTMAAGIETGKITPDTTYTDKGEEKIDNFTIKNSDKQAHGVETMTQVLEKSLNTGTIFVERLLGRDLFRQYVQAFGFGAKTDVGVSAEAKGDISPLDRKGQVFAATASFGQGISVTPLQMLDAYAAIGNGGNLMKPRLVDEIIRPDGTREPNPPQVIRRVVSRRTARLVSGMLVDVVENGHGKRAAVPGYYVAGKTGTAQIPDPKGGGYLKEADASIGSFVGFAPADDPKFVMLIKMDRPKTVAFAESSAAPAWGEMAKFLLNYLHVPTERPIVQPPPLPPQPNASTTAAVATSTH